MAERRAPWLLAPAGSLEAGAEVVLERGEARHLAKVLRRTVGDPLILVDGSGAVAEGRLHAVGRGRATVTVEALSIREPPPELCVELAVGVVQGQTMDWAVQKATEVGVAELWPLVTERSQLAVSAARNRCGHWRRVALQALKQCHRPWAMKIGEPVRLADLVELRGGAPGLVAVPRAEPLAAVAGVGDRLLLVGPEGGLTAAEEELLLIRGWRAVGLGRFVLRTETAAVVGAALLQSAAAGPGRRVGDDETR